MVRAPMPVAGAVALYSAGIVLGALGAALVPLYAHAPSRMLTLLAFAAGVMFGAAFFHMVPEAFEEGGGPGTFTLLTVGFGVMFLIERLLRGHPELGDGPATMGVTAFFGLSLHTLMDGVALGSATEQGAGATAFAAILAHKVPSSLSLASILRSEGRRRVEVLGFTALYASMVPIGAGLYAGLQHALHYASFAPRALAFSAGTFLYVAAVDLLPHVVHHTERKGRVRHVVAFLLGLLLMSGLTRLVVHPHA